MRVISRYHEVIAALEDPAYGVPPVAPATTGVAWLRSHVARFSEGADHDRRRALAVAELAKIDPDGLRTAAGDNPTAILAAALGLDADVVSDVAAIARVYLPGEDDPAADAAVERLVKACRGGSTTVNEQGPADDAVAARIGLLVQAHTATAALVARSIDSGRSVAETVRVDSPVPGTRRLDPDGDLVFLDFVAANTEAAEGAGEPVTFGAGRHRCPGRAHALAIAEGLRA